MRISGGTMLGYCATGRLNIVTSPTTTCKMAMTIATIGRLMKKRYMMQQEELLSLLRHRAFVGLRIDHWAFLDLLRALGDDPLARLKPFVNQPVVAHLLPRPHRFQMDRVRFV